MNRTIKFRVWRDAFAWSHDQQIQPGVWLGDPYIGPDGRAYEYDYEIISLHKLEEFGGKIHIEQFTGLTDSQGREIYEGDILLASEARYEMTLAESSGGSGPSIYVVDHDKPLPAPDVPWFKAVVEWNESMCAFWLRYLEKRADWGPGTSTPLNDKHYTYTVVGNVHETPITTSGSTS